jgi:hypothetical protein
MVPLLATLFFADPEPPYPTVKPIASFTFESLIHEKNNTWNRRNRVFIEPTKGQALVLFASYVVIIDLKTLKTKDVVRLSRKHPNSIQLEGRTLVFHHGTYTTQEPFNRVYDLDRQVELQTPWISETKPEHTELYNFLHAQRRNFSAYFELDSQKALTVEGKLYQPWLETSLNIRALSAFTIIKSTPVEFGVNSLFNMSPDKQILTIQDENASKTVLYSTRTLKPLRTVWNETGRLNFDPNGLWAVNHGQQRNYYYIMGGRPLLVNLRNFNIYLLGYPPIEVHDAVVDSSLNLAVTINDKTVDFFQLPK